MLREEYEMMLKRVWADLMERLNAGEMPRHQVFCLEDFQGEKPIGQGEARAILNLFEAFWIYEGEPRPDQPHARLKGEEHSNGFIVAAELLNHPRLCRLFARQMVERIFFLGIAGQIDVVVSSAYSAVNLGYEVASQLSNRGRPDIEYRIAEKDAEGNPTVIRRGIDPRKRVLIVNELMTTGEGSTWETKKAVLDCNGSGPPPEVLEPALVLFHRSRDEKLADGTPVEAIYHFDIDSFPPGPETCRFCAAGSEALKPKVDGNWERHFSRR